MSKIDTGFVLARIYDTLRIDYETSWRFSRNFPEVIKCLHYDGIKDDMHVAETAYSAFDEAYRAITKRENPSITKDDISSLLGPCKNLTEVLSSLHPKFQKQFDAVV